jgi:hypothetical protein
MSRRHLLIGMPVFVSGPNKGRLDRKAAATAWELTEAQLSKAYNNWIQIFRYPDSALLFVEYLSKIVEAGISPDDVGMGAGKYQLARYGDVGAYADDNCRFIPAAENLAEQVRNGKHAFYRGS